MLFRSAETADVVEMADAAETAGAAETADAAETTEMAEVVETVALAPENLILRRPFVPVRGWNRDKRSFSRVPSRCPRK